MTQEKEIHPPETQVKKSAEPAKVVGLSYAVQSAFYDWIKILSIVPAKVICDGIKGVIQSQKNTIGETLAGYGMAVFKTSLKTDEILVGIVGRAMSVYLGKAYAPYGDPVQAFETATKTKTFLYTPEQNLKEGRLGEYMAQRVLYTASTNVLSTACGMTAKILLLGMAMPATVPAFCAVYISSYTAILTARIIADVLQDMFGVSSLNPDRKKLLDSLQEARDHHAQKTATPGGAVAHV